MSVLRGILKNTAALTVSTIFARILGMVFFALFARAVGDEGFGAFSFVISLVAIFMILPGFGFDALLTREVAKYRENTRTMLGHVISIKSALMVATGIALFGVATFKGFDRETASLTALLFTSAIVLSFRLSHYCVLRAHERMDLESLQTIIGSVLRAGLGITAILLGYGLIYIVCALVIGDILSLILVTLSARNVVANSSDDTIQTRRIPFARMAIPFGVMSVIEIIFSNTDTLMIKALDSTAAVGWYAASDKLLIMVYLLPSQFMTVLYPVLSRLSVSPGQAMQTTFRKSFAYMFMLSLPVAVGGYFVSGELVRLVFGAEFVNSTFVFQILVWVAICNFVGYVNGPTLIAAGREKLFASTWFLFTLANVVLDYIFIKKMGYLGACYVTLILNSIMLVLYSVMAHREMKVSPDWPFLAKAGLATLVMAAVLLFIREWSSNLFILVPAGGLSFLLAARLVRMLPAEDVAAIKESLQRRRAS